MNPAFAEAEFLEFHRVFKREFFGWLYNNAACLQISNDFFYAYQSGGEL
jgi:hypothetical protein